MIYNLSDVVDDLGLHCPECLMPAFVKKIETGPRIGKRISFECVSGHKFQAQERAARHPRLRGMPGHLRVAEGEGETVKLMHFSNATAITVESRYQETHAHFKPRGFWVSDESTDDGWSAWCQRESFNLGRNAFSVELAPDTRLLTLADELAVREFDAEYASSRDRYYVDWWRVAERYQGILITPYQWTLRLSDVRWYYPWDCASGCIWDASAVASVTLAESVEATR